MIELIFSYAELALANALVMAAIGAPFILIGWIWEKTRGFGFWDR